MQARIIARYLLSPALFILVADVLYKLFKNVGSLGIIHGISHVEAFQSITSLHFTDDTLIFYAAEKENLIATKAILLDFEGTYGLKINFHKSTVMGLNMKEREVDYLVSLLNCYRLSLPISYLGLPLHDRKLPKYC